MDRTISWQCCGFEQLDVKRVFQLFQLRQKVFVLEQNCLYPDIDDADLQAIHVLGSNSDQALLAYLRILAPGVSYDEPAIGRVVVDPVARGDGLGRLLIEQGIRFTHERFGSVPIRISAQTHLLDLYRDAGFESVGEGYMEDGIPHQQMLLQQV